MMTEKEVIEARKLMGNRIKQARAWRGLSQQELGKEIGTTRMAISKYESGRMMPVSENLLAIAKATGVRLEYLFRPYSVSLEKIRYKRHHAISRKLFERIEARIVDKAERFFGLLSVFPDSPIKRFHIPCYFPKKILYLDEVETVAEITRNEWGLGLNALPHLPDTLEEQGVLVLAVDTSSFSFGGLMAMVEGIPLIAVSKNASKEHQRFCLAHELGHLMLEERLAPNLNMEEACDRFAGAFLVPQQAVRQSLGHHRKNIELLELFQLRQEFGMSMFGWLCRAKELGVIEEGVYKNYAKLFSMRGWKEQEPGEVHLPEQPQIFERLVYRALAEGLIGISKAAEFLGTSVAEFRSNRFLELSDVTSDQRR